MAPLSAPADVDIDLEQVFGDVGSLPAMVTPICDFDELIVAQPTVVSPGFLQPSTGSVGCPSVPPTVPAVSTPEKSLLLGAAEMTQGQPWAGPSSGGGGSRRVAISLQLPWPLVRRLHLLRMVNRTQLGGTQTSMNCLVRGCLISTRIIRTPAPRLATVAAGNPGLSIPESARLLSRSPEYWVHHMGREKTLSAALQLQHDAGLILSNVQVLQQLVTALNRTSSDVLRAVHSWRPFPTSAMHQVMPSYRVRRAAHYMTAMGLWRPPIAPEIRGPLPFRPVGWQLQSDNRQPRDGDNQQGNSP